MGTSKPIIPVLPFHLKFLNRICRLSRRNFKWAAPGMSGVAMVMKLYWNAQVVRQSRGAW